MAQIKNARGTEIIPEMYPFGTTLGSDIAVTTPVSGVSAVVMPSTAIGVYNAGTTEITLALVPPMNDHTKPFIVKVAAGTSFRDCAFNAVLVTGSTGHASATTHYYTSFGRTI
jgi:hypothetical protein